MSRLDHLPTLGVGLGFRDRYRTDVFRHRDSIDFLEIVADHFFEASFEKTKHLDLMRRNFCLIPHGLSLSLGTAEGIDRTYLSRIAKVVHQVNPPWWSEHIAFTHAGGIDIGHLTSIPRTRESLNVLRQNIRVAQDSIALPLILENITESIRYPGEQLDEAAFLGELLDENDCGLLLDVTNLYTNSINQRFDPLNLLHRLPPERIVQLHFAGGYWEGERLIDSHSEPTPNEVWALLHEVVKFASVKGVILERDEKLPPIEELLTELDRARKIFDSVHRDSLPVDLNV